MPPHELRNAAETPMNCGLNPFMRVSLVFFLLAFCLNTHALVPSRSISSLSVSSGKEKSVSSSFAESSSSSQDSVHLIAKYRTALVGVVAWPFEKVVQPTFNALMYPLIPPVHYIFDRRVIERGLNLITFGDRNQIMVYPTFKLQTGTTGNSIGFAYRQQGLFSDSLNDNFFAIYNEYINADWDARTRYSFNKIAGTTLSAYAGFRYKEDSDNLFTVVQFKNNEYVYSDSSWSCEFGLGNPLFGKWSLGYSFALVHQRFNLPTASDVPVLPSLTSGGDSLLSFDRYERGMYQHYWEFPMGVQLVYNNRENTHAPTDGQFLRLNWNYVPVSHYKNSNEPSELGNDLNHNYYTFSAVYQNYFLIGQKQYSLSRDESRANQRYIENMSMKDAMTLLSPEQLRETLLERKVIAFQFRFRQMYEVESGGAPFSSFGEINSNTPLRGYTQSFFDKNYYAFSAEYRWPIVEYVDGVVFNEYALFGDTWTSPQMKNLHNSWGFGIRVRMPEQFLTRFQIGFHVLQGINIVLTVNPEFQ